jgi:ParB-like chromosome segregation protein Spo0J
MPKPVKPDKTVELPKFGDRIPAERFHVSKMNVRFNEPFGESERDKILIENLRRGEIVAPFKARPEDGGWGVYVGRRRFLSKEKIGTKAYVVGKDWLVENVPDEQARKESLIDNLDILREEMDPITRARALQDTIYSNMAGVREVARDLGIGVSTLSEYIKVLELTPPMQEAVRKGQIYYRDALTLAKMKVGEIQEKKLAEAAETGGRDGYMATLETVQTGQERRGIPAGKWIVERIMFERAHEQGKYDELDRRAKARNMTVAEYIKTRAIEDIKA